ncbi:iron chelate uptake ABC transporter family permease subunit [Nisaea sp.]|uniref:ABC transporter permease n=2 Tax=Alphaproteobacteria TaxID=28211 RepID=UPI0032992914
MSVRGHFSSFAQRAGLPLCLVLLCGTSLAIGANPLDVDQLLSFSGTGWLTLSASRLPRLAALILTGVGLSCCGLILQQVLRNRFAEPATTGGLDAAKLGVLAGVVLVPSAGALIRTAFAMTCCFIASLIYVAIIRRIRLRNTILIPVIGLMYGSVLGALAESYAYANSIAQSMQGWLLGDFSKVIQGNYEIIYVILPVVLVTYLYARQFTLLGMGQDMATSLGLSYPAMLTLSLFLVSITVAVTVITIGAVPFVGLVVPNLVALWLGDNLRRTLPVVAMGGATLLVACDILGRLIIYPFEVPIGLTVGGIGGTMFLALIIWKHR